MLKTSKILVLGFGATTLALGAYIIYDKYIATKKVENQKKEISVREFDTLPEKDSSLDKLNKILADNSKSESEVPIKNDIVIESYENIDKNSPLYDSLVKAGSVKDVNANKNNEFRNSEGNTIIKADKFLDRKTLAIKGYTYSKNNTDSLLNTLVNLKPSNNGKLVLEFWESPINFKGYRLGKDKLIVFGIVPNEVSLIKYKNDLYLSTINNIYLIKPCSEFCNLRPIKDKAMCAEIMRNAN